VRFRRVLHEGHHAAIIEPHYHLAGRPYGMLQGRSNPVFQSFERRLPHAFDSSRRLRRYLCANARTRAKQRDEGGRRQAHGDIVRRGAAGFLNVIALSLGRSMNLV
jgi:hypothetical protein